MSGLLHFVIIRPSHFQTHVSLIFVQSTIGESDGSGDGSGSGTDSSDGGGDGAGAGSTVADGSTVGSGSGCAVADGSAESDGSGSTSLMILPPCKVDRRSSRSVSKPFGTITVRGEPR